MENQLIDPIVLLDNGIEIVLEDIQSPIGQPAIDIPGNQALLAILPDGSITAPDDGNTAVQISGDNVLAANLGFISGDFNGISSTGNDFRLLNFGTIQSNSRAVDLSDGDGIFVLNTGSILGTDNQRNGTLYVDGTVDDLRLLNSGSIDAGEDNLGDAVSVQVGAVGDLTSEDINIVNNGLFQGRGDGSDVFNGGRVAANGSSGLRFFNGSGEPEATITGSVTNQGTITSEVNVGFLGGVVVEDGVAFDGQIINSGLISGPRNGLYIGNADHNLQILNSGQIESGSRVVNLDGDNVTLTNQGNILATGNQRNGTIYLDGTADNNTVNNQGLVDAGEGNLGDAISIQVGATDDATSEDINIINSGLLQGRGDGPEVFAGGRVGSNGSSGLRFFNGVGEAGATVTGSVINQGTITAEVNVGFLGGLVVEDNVAFDGLIANSGLISGSRNGLYIGNAEHDLQIINTGQIESGSRVVNLDGDNVTLSNQGNIVGTGNQRNGTIYLDGTADNITVNNQGLVDAGEGNLGDAISIQVGATGDASSENIDIVNSGLLQGRGDGPDVFAGGRVASNGSSGLRFFNGAGESGATVTGSVVNQGTITAEVNVGFLGGVVVEDGVAFEGQIANSGLISGPRNGLYIGNADHDLQIVNTGQIESGSRAVNLDGDNITLINQGSILGTDDQRNGTVYLDGTADNITVNNQQGVIDAGAGNSGSGVSVQVGTANGLGDGLDDLELAANIVNSGLIQGRGEGNVPAGVRLFVGSGLTEATFTGNITNEVNGVIASEQQAGILIGPGVIFDGQIINNGTITGGNGLAIDADDALGSVNVLNAGILNGDVRLGAGNDRFIQISTDDVIVNGGLGEDEITGGDGNDILNGGSHDDLLTGGLGSDTFKFESVSGIDVVTDFSTFEDILDVGAIFDEVSNVLGAATQVGTSTLIDFGDDNAVLLLNVNADDLTSDNFAFT